MARIVTDPDRLAIRHRPDGQPIMHQTWGKLLFIHWRVPEQWLRPFIPEPLDLDLYGDSAWLAITPFTMWDIRAFPPFVPAIPGLNSMEELNVRTYVHLDGVPGVWFLSLDANSSAAVLAARTFFRLPYFNADISFEQEGDEITYELHRDDEKPAQLSASWKIGKPLPQSQPGSREFFLTERYCLYTADEETIYRARIYHQPWPLQQAELLSFDTDIFAADGLPKPQGQPLAHYAEEVSVNIWPLEEVE
ncbi:MAG TPA: DUF2071 domain-containing protein [Pyrinomonadaceae bacterium]|nr:DUF2071 domain-containing protein [Pyrinomonadaceae bacterium]